MVVLNWIVFVQTAWTIVGVILSMVLATALSACPRDVSTRAHSCFTSYSFHFQNMQNSPQKLCCGVDVEILRAFCQSYTSAMACVNQLKRDCPEETYQTIDSTLNNLNDVQAELHELCSDDSMIEIYAMYQSCFTAIGGKSELCLLTHLNNSAGTNIRFLTKLHVNGVDQFCRDMKNTIECVQRNVQKECGEEAAQLVHVLVKPMIRQSTDCDYSVLGDKQKTTKRPFHDRRAFVNDDIGGSKSTRNNNHRTRNGSCDLREMLVIVVFLTSLSALFIWSRSHT